MNKPTPSDASRRTPPYGFRSFRSQVALGFGLLAVVVAVTLSIAFGSMFAEKSARDEATDLRQIANNAAKALSEGLVLRSHEVDEISRSSTLWSDGLESDRVFQTLARARALTPHSAWIGVTSADGIVRASTDRILLGADVGERPWFQQGKSHSHIGDVHAAKLLAKLLPPGRTGEPQRFVDFSAPIVLNGRVIGVLGMHGSWDWARSVVESMLPDDAPDRQLEVFVLDSAGRVIYASEKSAPLTDERMDTSANTQWSLGQLTGSADGAKFLVASARVSAVSLPLDLGWTVVSREPAAIAFAAARAGVSRALVFGLLAALGACAIGWFVAERLTRPLRQIAAAAKSVEDDEDGARIPTIEGSTEISQLSAALAGMTAKLRDANSKLESRVRERTAELEAANAALDRLARIDPLTGLLNRRAMEEQFQRALASAKRRKAPLSLLIVDIDHFKRVNDTYGHDVGDVTLQAMAAALEKRLRQSDVVARLGGEEFVAILPDTDASQARVLATQLVEEIADQHFEVVHSITVSCGVAQVQAGTDTAHSVLKRADEALYRAKGEGRNRASFADTSIELGFE